MTNPLEQQIIDIIQDTLRCNEKKHDVLITVDDSMETVAAWDSLTFISIFIALNEAFGATPDFDDAIHYTSVKKINAYFQGHVK